MIDRIPSTIYKYYRISDRLYAKQFLQSFCKLLLFAYREAHVRFPIFSLFHEGIISLYSTLLFSYSYLRERYVRKYGDTYVSTYPRKEVG